MSSDVAEMTRPVSVVPNGWESRKLEEVCRLWNGRAYKKEELLERGKYVVLRVGNFFTNDRWYYSDLELDNEKYCDDGDLLYAWSASFGPRVWAGGKVIYHYHIWKIAVDDRLIDKDFLFHFLDWDAEQIKASMGSGSTMIHVTKGAMEKRAICLPPLDEQRRIAEVLRSVDEAIAATIASIEQAQSTLDCVRATFLNPMADATALGDVCDVIGGYAFKSTSFIESGVKVLRISNITEAGVDFSGRAVCVSQEDVRGLDRFRLKRTDTVVALSGATTGKMCVFSSDDAVYANQRVAFIRVRAGLADQAYINHTLSLLTASVRQSAYGGAQPNISTKEIAMMEIALPSLPEQRELADVLDALSQAVAFGERALSAHQATKATLMSNLLSGHLRVPA